MMRNGRTTTAVIVLAIVFFSFTAGFLAGRMTIGGTYTISTEIDPLGKSVVGGDLGQAEASAGNAVDFADGDADADGDSVISQANPEEVLTDFPVNINTSGKEELMLLPSIGEVRANNIIAYRKKNGPYRSIADIMQVSGIGEAIYDDIKEYITCDASR